MPRSATFVNTNLNLALRLILVPFGFSRHTIDARAAQRQPFIESKQDGNLAAANCGTLPVGPRSSEQFWIDHRKLGVTVLGRLLRLVEEGSEPIQAILA